LDWIHKFTDWIGLDWLWKNGPMSNCEIMTVDIMFLIARSITHARTDAA